MSHAEQRLCVLADPRFKMLGDLVFRMSEGRAVPSLVIRMDNHDALLPLRSVAREFGIEPDSADGRMFAAIEEALEFVVALRPGDPLPSELDGGQASWDPSEQDRIVAFSRVKRELVRSVFARIGDAAAVATDGGAGWENAPANRAKVQKAIDLAAEDLDHADRKEIANRVETLGDELSFIESLRRRFARSTVSLTEKLLRLRMEQFSASRREMLQQVQSLARVGLRGISSRFDLVDGRLDDILPLLRDMPETIGWLRGHRNWLHKTYRGWDPVFTEWAGVTGQADEFLWKTIERTYAFLAPRYMSFQEWKSTGMPDRSRRTKVQVW